MVAISCRFKSCYPHHTVETESTINKLKAGVPRGTEKGTSGKKCSDSTTGVG